MLLGESSLLGSSVTTMIVVADCTQKLHNPSVASAAWAYQVSALLLPDSLSTSVIWCFMARPIYSQVTWLLTVHPEVPSQY